MHPGSWTHVPDLSYIGAHLALFVLVLNDRQQNSLPRRFFPRSRPFVRIWSVARVRKKYGCFAVYLNEGFIVLFLQTDTSEQGSEFSNLRYGYYWMSVNAYFRLSSCWRRPAIRKWTLTHISPLQTVSFQVLGSLCLLMGRLWEVSMHSATVNIR